LHLKRGHLDVAVQQQLLLLLLLLLHAHWC